MGDLYNKKGDCVSEWQSSFYVGKVVRSEKWEVGSLSIKKLISVPTFYFLIYYGFNDVIGAT